jgi:elongation factor P hydroxylase
MGRATLPQTGAEMQSRFVSADLERLFWQCFYGDYATVLAGGAKEPFYAPADGVHPARIFYTADYFRSALHEIAHWCVAGPERRLLPDFGYWYAADGRDAAAQAAFQQVEVKPQALELLFCAAAGHVFRVSLDNLGGESGDPRPFEEAVLAQAQQLLVQGLSARVSRWLEALSGVYRGEDFDPSWLEQVFRYWQDNAR